MVQEGENDGKRDEVGVTGKTTNGKNNLGIVVLGKSKRVKT